MDHVVKYEPAKPSQPDKKNIFFQPKLTINNPNDDYEKEADAMADKVMRMQQPLIESKALPINSVQRKCAHCEEEEKKAQRKEINADETTIDHTLESYVGNLNGGGQRLSNEMRNFYEPRFGYDLSNVRVHTDAVAAKSAQSINALAYTSGNNIVFNNGQYSPNTDSGKRLLGHELTHVIQQSYSGAAGKVQAQHRCDPPESNPCSGRNFNSVMAAFRTAANWLPQARQRIADYMDAPSARANIRAARALRRHFGWNENIRQHPPFPDIPQMVLRVIDTILAQIRVPIGADCPASTPSADRDGAVLHARAPSTWSGTNCYIFYPPYFSRNTNQNRAKTALHEMMHRWAEMSDILYEWEDGYPPGVRAAQNNADSFAGLIRDLG